MWEKYESSGIRWLRGAATLPSFYFSTGLPAGLGDSGDESVGRQFAEGDTGKFETAQEGAPTPRDQATVDESHWTRIARKLAESDIIFLCLELGTEFRPLRHGGAFAFVSFKP